MNASHFLAVILSASVVQFAFGAEANGQQERRRPRHERVEPPGKAEVQPDKAATELCNEAGDAKYAAVWQKGEVTLTASGSHATAGYRVFFEQSMLMIYPPEFSLKHQRPTGMVAQVITPVSVKMMCT